MDIRRYEICWRGAVDPDKIQLKYNATTHHSLTLEQINEKNQIIEKMIKSGKKIEILPLYKFLSLSQEDQSLIFTVNHTDFGEYLLTDVTHPEWFTKFGGSIMAHPLSISAVTITSDNFILLGRRSQSVLDQPDMIQTLPGGFIHPPDTVSDSVEKELFEELLIKKEEISQLLAIGFARILKSGKPELLLRIQTRIPFSEVCSRKGMDNWEFIKIESLKNEEKEIKKFCRKNKNSLAPTSCANLESLIYFQYGNHD